MHSLHQIQSDLLSGKENMVGLLDKYLTNIKEAESLNIYIEIYDLEAREKAAKLDKVIKENPESLGKLFGAFVSHKDVICYKGHAISAGSKILSGYTSGISATAIERILAEDAILIGRVNCDEFGMGSSNENSVYGPTRNGINEAYIPGGSSGASAVSVQMDTCLLSLGSDTGGSVRQPAAFCGISGFKPGYGSISRYGLIAYASSFDQIGILCRSTEDIATVYEIMAGADNYDSTVTKSSVKETSVIQPPTIAILSDTFERIKPLLKLASEDWLAKRKEEGISISLEAFALMDYLVPVYYILTTAEASSNLNRYDGVKYGYRAKGIDDLESMYRKSRTEGFGAEVKRRIMLGTFVLSEGYFDAYYTQAQKIRKLIKSRMDEIFEQHTFIVLPTTADTAWKIGAENLNPVDIYLSDIFTVLASLAGIPAISLPLGIDQNGLPFGIQLMAQKGQERVLLDFCHAISVST